MECNHRITVCTLSQKEWVSHQAYVLILYKAITYMHDLNIIIIYTRVEPNIAMSIIMASCAMYRMP